MNLNEALDALIESTKKPVSAGVAIIRENNGLEILLTHPSGHYNNKFGFPKGLMESGEDEIQTAKREGMEETGLDFEILEGQRLEQDNPNKKVIIYLARLKSNKNLDEEGKAVKHDWENDLIKFFPIDKLPEVFSNQKRIKEDILKLNLKDILNKS